MSFPTNISFFTIGARDMTVLRAFYGALGWQERPGSNDEFTAYEAGGVRMALYPLDELGAEAAPGEPLPGIGWNGTTLAVNVASREAVDESFRSALDAGARRVAEPVDRSWGGYSGYVADPEGNRWEIAWAPEP